MSPADSNKVLNLAVLDLQPDWAIKQVYPRITDDNFIPIDPGREEFFPLDASLPPGSHTDAKDIIKVFATLDQTSFSWLELPSLDQPKEVTRSEGPVPRNPLEQLMAAMTKDRPATRTVNSSQSPSKEWTAAQIEVKINRKQSIKALTGPQTGQKSAL